MLVKDMFPCKVGMMPISLPDTSRPVTLVLTLQRHSDINSFCRKSVDMATEEARPDEWHLPIQASNTDRIQRFPLCFPRCGEAAEASSERKRSNNDIL